MLINGHDVLMEDFTIDTEINAVAFKQSSGRTRYRSRGLSYRSNLKLAFDDVDGATEFIDGVVSAGEIPMVLEEDDISPYGDELEVGGGAIPAVYVKSFIGNGVDAFVEVDNTQITNFISVLATVILEASWSANGAIYSSVESGVNPDSPPFLLYIRPDRSVQVTAHGTNPTSSSSRKYVKTNEKIPLGVKTEVFCYLDLSSPSNQIQISINGVLATAESSDNDSFSNMYTLNNPLGVCGSSFTTFFKNFFNGEIAELYTSTNPLAITPSLIAQYSTGEEHFTQALPDVVAVKTFIGNGVDSYIKKEDSTTIGTFFGASFRFSLPSPASTYMLFDSSSKTNSLNIGDIYIQQGSVNIRYQNGAGSAHQKTLDNIIVAGEKTHIYVHTNLLNNRAYDLYINGVLTALSYTTTNPTPSLNQLLQQDQITLGAGYLPNTDTFRLFMDGEMWDFQYSFNSNFALQSSREQYFEEYDGNNRPYATNNEQFTQSPPDALPIDWLGGATQGELGWLGGAVQGEIEISPEIPGEGTLNFYLERAPICKVDGYNKITVELRTLLSKDNITYPTIYNANILDELPYEWKYRENIYNKFNNNVTWGGTNSHSQNSTTGRSIRFDFKLTKEEYLELRKFIFNKRYTPFTYNSLVGDFAADTLMAIEDYSMSFTGKLYTVTLILEEQ
jgi:hypothetical protein